MPCPLVISDVECLHGPLGHLSVIFGEMSV